MTLVISTFADSPDEPCAERIDDGRDTILWADEVSGGWGKTDEQEHRAIECGGIEHGGFIVIELTPPKVASSRAAGIVTAWDEALT